MGRVCDRKICHDNQKSDGKIPTQAQGIKAVTTSSFFIHCRVPPGRKADWAMRDGRPPGWRTSPYPPTLAELVVWFGDRVADFRQTMLVCDSASSTIKRTQHGFECKPGRKATLDWGHEYAMMVHRWLEHRGIGELPAIPQPFPDFRVGERELTELLRFLVGLTAKTIVRSKVEALTRLCEEIGHVSAWGEVTLEIDTLRTGLVARAFRAVEQFYVDPSSVNLPAWNAWLAVFASDLRTKEESNEIARLAFRAIPELMDWAKAEVSRLTKLQKSALEGPTARVDDPAAPSSSLDTSAFQPAGILRQQASIESHKKLLAILRVNVWIRTIKPSRQRLAIHAGDWAKYVATRDAAAFGSLEAPAEVVDKYLADADRRKSEVRAKKNALK